LLGAFLSILTVFQGEAVWLPLAADRPMVSASAAWNGRRVPFVRDGDRWFTVLGVDLAMAPGEYSVEIVEQYAGGKTRTTRRTLTVRPREFPTTRLKVAPKYVELSPSDQARAARERAEIDAIYETLTAQAHWREPFQSPLAGVTGGRNFGHRRVFNDKPRAPHSGADLAAATGTPVRSINRGRVVLAKELFFGGKAVFVDHGLGVISVYLHLDAIGVAAGERVERGQVIGRSGATGRVTGPHLHWGVRILDARVDPFSLLGLGND